MGWNAVLGGFDSFANSLTGGMNALIRAIGKLPIPRVSIGVGYKSVGPLSIPYPTFSVSTRPLSSYVGLPQIASIPSTVKPSAPLGAYAGGLAQNAPSGTTNNYFSLSAADFGKQVERITNAPNAQARAVGAP